MKFVLWPTTEISSDEIVMKYYDSIKTEFEIPDKNNLTKIVFGLICVPEKLKILHSDKAYMSYKFNTWTVSVYLDFKYICSNPLFEDLDKYVKKCICERIDELKKQKNIRGIKDKTMFDDIKNLFFK